MKNWYKAGKSLNNIIDIKTFSQKEDFIKILKEEFQANKIDINNFTASDIKKIFPKRKLYIVISLLNKNEIIKLTKTEKNRKFYKLFE